MRADRNIDGVQYHQRLGPVSVQVHSTRSKLLIEDDEYKQTTYKLHITPSKSNGR